MSIYVRTLNCEQLVSSGPIQNLGGNNKAIRRKVDKIFTLVKRFGEVFLYGVPFMWIAFTLDWPVERTSIMVTLYNKRTTTVNPLSNFGISHKTFSIELTRLNCIMGWV